MHRRSAELCVFVAATVAFIPLSSVVARASRPAGSSSLLLMWVCSALIGALLLGGGARLPRVLGTFAVALSLSPLAVGTATVPVYLMMSILILSGAAVLLRVPMLSLPEISVSAQDVERLTCLLDTLSEGQRAAVWGLEAELSRAHVLAPARIPDNVVTMNSRVVYEDVESGAAREAVLVYPDEADAACGRISVLAPLGSALLGLRVGQAIDWPLGRGQHRRIRVLSLLYQPEAAGDFHL